MMKKKLLLLSCILTSFYINVNAQKTINVLFVGNSFTASNDLQNIVKQFMLADGTPVNTYAYAPGGISVGDVSMGTAAHMNNPLVFDLIRDKEWDFLVLQDNQGRFALDSAKFPSTAASKVIEGHIKIRDSFHYHHPCAKMIWFSGWGFEDEDTLMINKITNNYRVLNDSAKDVIAPIGPAWKQSIIEKPFYKLWSPDGAHPDVTGSYLTAAVIYGTITQKDVSANLFNHSLIPPDAAFLRMIAQKTLINPAVRIKSNLKGIEPISISWDLTHLKAPAGKLLYRWYLDNSLLTVSSDSIFTPKKSGKYRLWTKDNLGNWQKSCEQEVNVSVGIPSKMESRNNLILSPNPFDNQLNISIQSLNAGNAQISIYDIQGRQMTEMYVTLKEGNNMVEVSSKEWPVGFYSVKVIQNGIVSNHKVVKRAN
ncbi:MAG: T9SS type A sorting domain-containing protein [Bacteroidota bacterium]